MRIGKFYSHYKVCLGSLVNIKTLLNKPGLRGKLPMGSVGIINFSKVIQRQAWSDVYDYVSFEAEKLIMLH